MEVLNEPLTLPELYQHTRKEIYVEYERQKAKVKPLQKKKVECANLPPCLKHILTTYPKTDSSTFNKLVMNIITWFQETDYDYQQAFTIVRPFLENYPHSTVYTTAKERVNHFAKEWEYITKTPQYVFECSFILGLGMPGNAFECRECEWSKEETEEKKEGKIEEKDPTKEAEPKSKEILLKYHLTDVGNAESFCELNGKDFAFIKEKKLWTKFDGVRWSEAKEEIKKKMIQTMRLKSKVAMNNFPPDSDQMKQIVKWCLSSESNFRLSAAMEIATIYNTKSYNDFDNDPLLLACRNGVINLTVGNIRVATPEDMLLKSTNLSFDDKAVCKRWLQFLDEIFGSDEEMIEFIQRAVGYTLTGLTKEQCLFILYGTGANGKSVFLNILEGLLGEYGQTTSFSTFKDKKYSDGIPNDIARIAGARMVKSVEIKEGTRLNEERIKSLTGGDKMMARFLHAEYFEFDPIAKFWIAVNHKPVIRGTDEAIWRRIRLIPFERTFPPENRDKELSEKLKSELSGILNWAVEGCLKYTQNGLEPVRKIQDATNKYRAESDIIAQFMQEKVEVTDNEGDKIRASELYNAYKSWCVDNGEGSVTGTQFGKKMVEKGYEKEVKQYVHYLKMRFL